MQQIVFPRMRTRREEWIDRYGVRAAIAFAVSLPLTVLLIRAPRIHADNRPAGYAPPGIRVTALAVARKLTPPPPQIRLQEERRLVRRSL